MTGVAIFTDWPGWHGRRLRRAFRDRGLEGVFVALDDCGIDLGGGRPRVSIPGFGADPPVAAFVRGVAGGTLEEVVFRLNVLHILEAAGIPVYNTGRAIERSVDKCLSSYLLAAAGIPTPATLVTTRREEAERFVRHQALAGHAVVSKPLFGSQGKGVVRLTRPRALPPAEAVNGVWYLQRFVASSGPGPEDWRLFVIGGRTAAAMRRVGSEWPTNVARGGRCQAAVPNPEASGLAERAVDLLHMDYAGVDLLHDRDGQWWLLEVNGIPAWQGLQGVAGGDIAALLADDLLARIRRGGQREVV